MAALSLMAGAVMAQQVDLTKPADMNKRTEELKNLKWGMFICWSFSTFSEKEWTPGVKDISFFKATEVDTDQWAKTAKEAGMGYILFLTKHHDGFCLWDTKTTDRKVTKAPLGKDVLKLLRKSCDKYGIKLALYFSEGEFGDHKDYHPGGYTVEMKKAQLKELLTQYGPIEYIWFDHAQTDGGLSHIETTAWCKQFQPGCFIGYNHGQPSGDIRLGEMGRPSPLEDPSGAGYGAGDAKAHKGYLLAEFTYPILPGHEGGAQWFYSLPKHDGLCHTAEKLYKDYLGAVKCGNIFSIDVGPDYKGKLRAIDVETLRKVGEMIRNPPSTLMAKPPQDKWKAELLKQPIRAFCVDFNWQVKGKFCFAAPGHWADADPAAQVKWCKEAGVNCIQTFILSCNGHAWYKGGPIPEQPGLKHDFLTEVAKQGHQQKMLVMGYYCISANSLWGKNHPDQSYGTPSGYHIPLTKDYVEYLCRSVRDVLKRTEIDGFMLDWMANTSGKWLDCEKTMYAELMGAPFPGADKVTAADKAAFDQKAVERCWTSIRDAARGVKPDCILWPNFLHHLNLEGVDWLLNEGPDPRETEAAEQRLGGRPVRLIQNQVGWPNHDARKVFSKSKYNTWDFYGFAAPYDNGLPLPVADYLGKPIDEFKGTDRMAINDKNIAALVRFYLGKPVEPAASETALSCGKPATASSTWGAGFEADKALDGNDESRWGAVPDARSGWLEVDLGKDTEVGCAVIKELGFQRTEAFAVECKAGDNWKELIKGSTIAGEKVLKFTPVTARYFRLNILKANDVPTIEGFAIYPPK